MSDPVAKPDDLAIFLGQEVDPLRAVLILGLAQDLCETIVSPCPATALGTVLAVAARAFNNVNSASQIGMGSAYATFSTTGAGGVGGLYLSRSDKATLRALAGRSGAFTVDMLPRGACEVQSVEVAATAGTFTLTFRDQTTAALQWNATASQVQAALEALSTIGAGNVLVDGSFVISFRNALGYCAQPQLRADDSHLTGVVSVVTLEQGEQPVWGG